MNAHGLDTAENLLPVSPAQARFWYLDRLVPGRPDATITVRWELRGEVSSHVVEDAVNRIIARHEVLRTRLIERDGLPVQQILDTIEFKLGQFDIRAVPIDDHEARIDAIARQMAETPFDLTAPPLLRMILVRTAPERAVILIAVHHCVFDGFSIGVLGHELGLLASAALAGHPPALPDLPLQYGDYALWQQDCATSPQRAEDTAFWARTLAGAPYFDLPGDEDGAADQRPAPRPARIKLPLPPGFGARLETTARAHDTSVFTLGVAAVTAALQRISGASEVCIATPVTGRDEVELEPLIGAFINTLILRIGSPADTPHRAHLARAKEVVTQALTHQACPLEDVLRAARPPRGTGQTPFTSVSFGLQRVFLREGSYGTLTLVSQPSHAAAIVYDVNINILGREAGWHLLLDYDAARYSERRMAALGKCVLDALDRLVEAPDTPIASLEAAPSPPVPVAPDASHAQPALEETKHRLAEIWAGQLGLTPQECEGDFFALGGYSILALRMLAQTEAAFGQRLELSRFLSDPTLEGCARALTADGAPPGRPRPVAPTWHIIPLRNGPPEGPVVVTVNQTFLYHRIAHRFDARTTVINIVVPDRDALERQRAMTYGAIIDDAVAILRTAHAHRPFVLMGHCVDGLAALEMARGLRACGERVLTVAMLDAWAPPKPGTRVGRVTRIARRLGRSLRRWQHYAARKLRGEMSWKDMLARNGIALRLQRATGAVPQQTDAERLMHDVNAFHQTVARAGAIEAWDGDALLFATQSQPRRATTRIFDWGGVLPADTAVHQIEGWHEDALLQGGYDALAAAMDARIARLATPSPNVPR